MQSVKGEEDGIARILSLIFLNESVEDVLTPLVVIDVATNDFPCSTDSDNAEIFSFILS